MPPVRFEAKDTVHAVSQAVITVLRHSTSGAFVSTILSLLEANTLEEAEQRLGQHLWSILHMHQGTDIPPEVAEEISTVPLRQHTSPSRTTTDFQDSTGKDSTLELRHKNPYPVRFREEGYDESLFFPPFLNEVGSDSADHTGAFLSDTSPGAGFYHGISVSEDVMRMQLMQNAWMHPRRSSTPIPKPVLHSGTETIDATSCQVHVNPKTTFEQMVNTLMTSNSSDETVIFGGTIGQNKDNTSCQASVGPKTSREQMMNSFLTSNSSDETIIFGGTTGEKCDAFPLDSGVHNKGGGNILESRTVKETFSDFSLLPPTENSRLEYLKETQPFQVLPCAKDVITIYGEGKTTHNDRSLSSRNKIDEALSLLSYISDYDEPFTSRSSMVEAAISELSETMAKDLCQPNPPQEQQNLRGHPSSPVCQNSLLKYKSSDLAQGQGLSDTADPSQNSISLLPDADEHWSSRHTEALNLSLGNQSSARDEETLSTDSIFVLHATDVMESDSDNTRQTEQIESKNESTNAEYYDNNSRDEVPKTRHEESGSSDETEVSLMSEKVISREDSIFCDSGHISNLTMLKNQSTSSGLTSELPENDDDIEYLHSVSVTNNSTCSRFASNSSNTTTSVSDLAASINNSDISLQKQDFSNINREERINSDRISLTDSCVNSLPVCTVFPPQQHSSPLLSGERKPLSHIPSSGDVQTHDSQCEEVCKSTTSFLPSGIVQSTHYDITSVPIPRILTSSSTSSKMMCLSDLDTAEKSISDQETHLDYATKKQVLQLSGTRVSPDPDRGDSRLPHLKPVSSHPNPRDKVLLIPKQASDDSAVNDKGAERPSSLVEVLPEPDVSDEGIVQTLQEHMSPGPTGLNEKLLQPTPEEVSRDLNRNDEGMPQPLPQEVPRSLKDSEGIIKSFRDKAPNPRNELLYPLCDQLSPNLHSDDDGESRAQVLTDSNESDEDSESLLNGIAYDPIITALQYAEFSSVDRSPRENSVSETRDPIYEQITDNVLPAVSSDQDTEEEPNIENSQTQNTTSLFISESPNLLAIKEITKSVNNTLVQKDINLELSVLSKDSPYSQRHQVDNISPGDLVSEVSDPSKLDKTLPLSSPSTSKADKCKSSAAKEKLTVHEASQNKSLGMISHQDPLHKQKSGSFSVSEIESGASVLSNDTEYDDEVHEIITSENNSSQLMHPEGESDESITAGKKIPEDTIPEHVLEQNAHPLVADVPRCNLQDINVHKKELHKATLSENKSTELQGENDLQEQKLSGNKSHEVVIPGDALKKPEVPQDKLSQVTQPENASERATMHDATPSDGVLQISSSSKHNLPKLKTQDATLDTMPKNVSPEVIITGEEIKGRAIRDNKVPSITIPANDSWEENIPEVAMPKDVVERLPMPDLTMYNNFHEGLMLDATMLEDLVDVLGAEDRLPDITMLEATILGDNSIEAMVLTEEEASQATRKQLDASSEVMVIEQESPNKQVPTGPSCDVTMFDDSSEVMVIESEPIRKTGTTGKLSCDVTMLDDSTEVMIIDSTSDSREEAPGRLSCDVTMLDLAALEHQLNEKLDYDSDDFVW